MLYTGVTSNLEQRVHQHKDGVIEGVSKKYNCKILVWFEIYDDMTHAITREKQIKSGSRRKKISLIETENPAWRDLSGDL